MNLLFDFTVDKATATIYVAREFAAELDLVWDAWTKAEMLEQWMAPKPWRIQTKEMDFREGGRWLYVMVSPSLTVGGGFVLPRARLRGASRRRSLSLMGSSASQPEPSLIA